MFEFLFSFLKFFFFSEKLVLALHPIYSLVWPYMPHGTLFCRKLFLSMLTNVSLKVFYIQWVSKILCWTTLWRLCCAGLLNSFKMPVYAYCEPLRGITKQQCHTTLFDHGLCYSWATFYRSLLWEIVYVLCTLHWNVLESLLLSGQKEVTQRNIIYSDFLVTIFCTDAERHLAPEHMLNLFTTSFVLKLLF